jgi:hypothetical protein
MEYPHLIDHIAR